jgi:hypothetical protein
MDILLTDATIISVAFAEIFEDMIKLNMLQNFLVNILQN